MLKIVLIILLALVVTSCTYLHNREATTETSRVEKHYSNFDTLDIRSMWILCSGNFQRLAPQIPPPVYIPTCDCIVDTIRKTYSKSSLQKLSHKEILGMNDKFLNQCQLNVPQSQL
jgi:hypothetical protein